LKKHYNIQHNKYQYLLFKIRPLCSDLCSYALAYTLHALLSILFSRARYSYSNFCWIDKHIPPRNKRRNLDRSVTSCAGVENWKII